MRSPRTRHPRAGFTLIEVTVAIFLFGIVMMGTMGVLLSAHSTAANSGTTSRATDLAMQYLNVARQLPIDKIAIDDDVLDDLPAASKAEWTSERPDVSDPATAAVINPANAGGGGIMPHTVIQDGPEADWVVLQYVNCRPVMPDIDNNRDCVDDTDITRPLPRLIRVKVFKSPGGRPVTLATAVTGEEIAPQVAKVTPKGFPAPNNRPQNLRITQSSATSLWITWDALGGATSYAVTADGDPIATVTYPSATYGQADLKTSRAASLIYICVEAISTSGTTSDKTCRNVLTWPGMPKALYDAGSSSVTVTWNVGTTQAGGVEGFQVQRRRRSSQGTGDPWVNVGEFLPASDAPSLADPDGRCSDAYRILAYANRSAPAVEGATVATSMTTAVSGCI